MVDVNFCHVLSADQVFSTQRAEFFKEMAEATSSQEDEEEEEEEEGDEDVLFWLQSAR